MAIYYRSTVVLFKNSRYIPLFLIEFHSSLYSGHSRFFKTYKRIAYVLYREAMKSDMKKFGAECENCEKEKYEAMFPVGFQQPLPIPSNI